MSGIWTFENIPLNERIAKRYLKLNDTGSVWEKTPFDGFEIDVDGTPWTRQPIRTAFELQCNQWNRNPRQQLEPQIASLEKCKIN